MMGFRVARATCAASLLLAACVSGPDHFHTLQAVPPSSNSNHSQFSAELAIRVNVPSLVDRNQLVLNNGTGGVEVLEHERWASPLTDQLVAVLGQDLEQRRPELYVTDRFRAQANGLPHYAIHVDVVALDLRRSPGVRMEVRWRVDRAGGGPTIGREFLSAATDNATAEALGRSVSQCLAALADRLAPLITEGGTSPGT